MTLTPEGNLTPADEAAFIREIERSDDSAAREHLAAGRSISYCEDDTPDGHVVQEYPDGRRELIHVALTPKGMIETVVHELPPVYEKGQDRVGRVQSTAYKHVGVVTSATATRLTR